MSCSVLSIVVPLGMEGQDDLAEKYRQVLTNDQRAYTSRGSGETSARSANVKLYEVDQLVCENGRPFTSEIYLASHAGMPCKSPLRLGTVLRSSVTNDDGWRRVSEIVVFVLQDFATS